MCISLLYTSISPYSTCRLAPPLCCIPPSQLTLRTVGRNGPALVVQGAECCARWIWAHRVQWKPHAGGGLELNTRDMSVGVQTLGTTRGLSCLEWGCMAEGLWQGMRLGESLGLVCLSYSLKLHFASPGVSLLCGKQGKDKISSDPLSIWGENEEAGISGSELKESFRDATPSLSKECFCRREPCYATGICPARWLCSVQETAYHIGIPPVQILKISHFKNKVIFVEIGKYRFHKKNKKNLNCPKYHHPVLTSLNILVYIYFR